ncbi:MULTISPECIES: zinc-binding dehydrogenase [unclassified Pseudoalteromonas]|uniref:zinc-binding dehydrogenase n=1 Tax=unclassified Pseudoalteromonas TaxID=194690 RepID=UPI002096BE0D|nr:zinc-binding dehydrogenase [Pseudoalteromonas sp. XMcav2-N]MCO7190045.1 zinc-binding dehydrogenase [Pseudoalteromonas sp. XMcav2-N]
MNNIIPDHFNAAVLTELNKDLQIKKLKVPELRTGQVLVKLTRAGLCRSQLMEARGHRGEDKYLPHLLGHEGVGNIVATGPGIAKVKVGDRVILGWLKGSGIDAGGTVFSSQDGETINGGPVTTFSEYTVVSENRITQCPDDINDDMAVLLGCALPTGAGIVLNQVQPSHEQTVLLIGLGGIGLSALLMLKHFRPKHVVVIDTNPEKVRIAMALGADHGYVLHDDIQSEIAANFPQGFDFAIECAGHTSSIEMAFELIHNAGKCIFASHPPNGEKIQLDPHALICGKRIEGSWGGGSNPDRDLVKIGRIIQELDFPMEVFISHQYTLSEINNALNDLENNQVVRAVIDLEG